MSLLFDERPSDSPLIEKIWYSRSEAAGKFTSTAEPYSEIVITRYRDRTTLTVRGPETIATPADIPPDAEFFGIVFKLGTFMPNLPAKLLLNRKDVTLPEASRKSFWLNGMAWRFPDFHNTEVFVDRLVRDGLLVHDSLVSDVLRNHTPSVSPRTIQRHFLQATGISHGTILQIQRAKQATALLGQGVSILDAVSELGYADQPHLTRMLKQFTGQTPAQILRQNQA
jgi:hypothetical protein